jgi:hypothetical protein
VEAVGSLCGAALAVTWRRWRDRARRAPVCGLWRALHLTSACAVLGEPPRRGLRIPACPGRGTGTGSADEA